MNDENAAIKAMLAASGLHPTDEDRAEIAGMYAMFRPAVDALYAMPEARYESPALVFQAAPKLDEWGV